MQSKHRPEGPEEFTGNGKYASTPARPSSLTSPSSQEMQEYNQTWSASDYEPAIPDHLQRGSCNRGTEFLNCI